jgi:hypothetical protein
MTPNLILSASICFSLLACVPLNASEVVEIDQIPTTMEVEVLIPGIHADYTEGVMVWVKMPRRVIEGEIAILEIIVENGRLKDDFLMSGIDVDDEFLDGFKVVSIYPEPRHRDHTYGVLELEYPVDLRPRETWELEITLRAEKPGIWIGEVDVGEGDDWITRIAQARVD